MTNQTSFLQRAMAGAASVAITMAIIVSYFATPHFAASAGMLA